MLRLVALAMFAAGAIVAPSEPAEARNCATIAHHGDRGASVVCLPAFGRRVAQFMCDDPAILDRFDTRVSRRGFYRTSAWHVCPAGTTIWVGIQASSGTGWQWRRP